MKKQDIDRLLAAAAAAQAHARCSFSHYPVGAAVLGASGRIYPGCNVESPTLILHTCAERAALFNAISHGERRIRAVCTISRGSLPCGSCRQAILELASGSTPVYSLLADPRSGRKTLVKTTVARLLPRAHTARQLLGRPPQRRMGFRREA